MANEVFLEACTQAHEELVEQSIKSIQAKAVLINEGPGECEWCGEQFPRLVKKACGRCRDEFKLG